MRQLLPLAIVLSLPLMNSTAAQDNGQCDCTSIISSCNAEVDVKGSWIEVTADTNACARVDYFIDGLPFVALVIDGADRRDWQNRTSEPEILIQSCQVCGQTDVEPEPVASTTVTNDEATDSDALVPLIKVTPRYPERARLNRIQGKVELEFTVTADGTVERPRVLSATPRRTFDQAAIAALKRWRYPAREPGAQPVTLREQIDFRLDGIQPSAGRSISTRPRPTQRPRNECIRESASYDFGDRVEVGLINACQIPVVVYACGIGTGSNVGLWVCHTPEGTGTALINRSTDIMTSKINAGLDLRYVQDQFLMRAPNSQYWWVACEPGDSRCRAAGLEWTSDIQRTPATVDPQKAARVTLARSR